MLRWGTQTQALRYEPFQKKTNFGETISRILPHVWVENDFTILTLNKKCHE